jgi:hypothetical protein
MSKNANANALSLSALLRAHQFGKMFTGTGKKTPGGAGTHTTGTGTR